MSRHGGAARQSRALPARPVTTFSLAACDLAAGQWGIAVASKFLAVGAVVPWAEPGVGAVATQAWANPRFGPDGLALLHSGLGADDVLARLITADDASARRQVGLVDGAGQGATFTGADCLEWAGGIAGPGFAAQGNLLTSRQTVDELVSTFRSEERRGGK